MKLIAWIDQFAVADTIIIHGGVIEPLPLVISKINTATYVLGGVSDLILNIFQ